MGADIDGGGRRQTSRAKFGPRMPALLAFLGAARIKPRFARPPSGGIWLIRHLLHWCGRRTALKPPGRLASSSMRPDLPLVASLRLRDGLAKRSHGPCIAAGPAVRGRPRQVLPGEDVPMGLDP